MMASSSSAPSTTLSSASSKATMLLLSASPSTPTMTTSPQREVMAPSCAGPFHQASVFTHSIMQLPTHPKGDVLAVPGSFGRLDVVMYDRETQEKVSNLKGGHSATVRFLEWSPNGKYLATAAAGDNQVILWDVDNRQDIECQKFEAQICSLAWKPKGNALAVIDSDGKFGVWEPVVPAHMTLPSDNSMQPLAIDREELLHFSDDDEQVPSEDDNKSSSQERELNLSPRVAHRSFRQKDIEHGTLKASSSLKKSESRRNKPK